MRKLFIYISLIALTATFTLGVTFAKDILQHVTEDVNFGDERESKLEENYTEAVVKTKHMETLGVNELKIHAIFCEKETAIRISGIRVANNSIYLKNCQILL